MNNWRKKFNNYNITFSWSELKVGRFGYEKNKFYLPQMLDDAIVLNFVINYLESNEEEDNPYIWELGDLKKPYNDEKIEHLLNLIADSDKNDLQAYYKWRWILVKNLLTEIDENDYVNTLFEINEFWLDLNLPQDMPHQYQGMGNKLTPKMFYSKDHYSKVILRHKVWLENEFQKFSS